MGKPIGVSYRKSRNEFIGRKIEDGNDYPDLRKGMANKFDLATLAPISFKIHHVLIYDAANNLRNAFTSRESAGATMVTLNLEDHYVIDKGPKVPIKLSYWDMRTYANRRAINTVESIDNLKVY